MKQAQIVLGFTFFASAQPAAQDAVIPYQVVQLIDIERVLHVIVGGSVLIASAVIVAGILICLAIRDPQK